MNFNKYLYGSVYRPEWDRGEDFLSEDISLMKQLCFNMVILPPDVIERASAAESGLWRASEGRFRPVSL